MYTWKQSLEYVINMKIGICNMNQGTNTEGTLFMSAIKLMSFHKIHMEDNKLVLKHLYGQI